MKLHLLIYNIKIHDNASKYLDLGSTMKCWVVANSQLNAERKVVGEMKEFGWQILDLISADVVLSEKYKLDDPDKENADFAVNSGFRCVVQTKPKIK